MHFGHVEAVWFLCVVFLWSVDTWLGICVLEAQDGAVVGVVWPLASSPASGKMNTLGFIVATPL